MDVAISPINSYHMNCLNVNHTIVIIAKYTSINATKLESLFLIIWKSKFYNMINEETLVKTYNNCKLLYIEDV